MKGEVSSAADADGFWTQTLSGYKGEATGAGYKALAIGSTVSYTAGMKYWSAYQGAANRNSLSTVQQADLTYSFVEPAADLAIALALGCATSAVSSLTF